MASVFHFCQWVDKPPSGATFCLWANPCCVLRMESMEAFLILGLFLVVYFLVLPRIPWLSRFA